MKKVYLFLSFSLVSTMIFGQDLTEKFKYKVTYQLTWQIDSTDTGSVQNERMILFIGDQISRFSSQNLLIADSLSAERESAFKRSGKFMAPPQTKFDYKLYKNLHSGKLYFFERIGKDRFKYTEELPLQDWEIHSETKEIAGYKAQKATTTFAGRNYVAWFTAEVSISEGPYKFSGLPGLIIEITDTQNYYHFKLSGFRKLNKAASMTIEKDRYTEVSKEDFLTAEENYNRDPLGALSKAGITIDWSKEREKEAEKELKENYKSRNNPIELE